MPKLTHSIIIVLFCSLILGCIRGINPTQDTSSLDGLKSLHYTKKKIAPNSKKSTSKIRNMALREIALTVGAQSGLAWRAKFIDEQLTQQARNLDAIYDFNALILEHNVLPPVLVEGRNTLNLADAQTIRISDRTFKVVKQARFITTPPNWRQYLWMDYKTPPKPSSTLLPKNKTEQTIWKKYITRGWNNGVEQGNTILEESIARLKEDLTGMILYRKLLAMNMVSPPYVSNTDLGITGDAEEIHIDDRVLRITALPALNINSDEWVAAVAKDESALNQLKILEKRVAKAKVIISNQTWQPIIHAEDERS